MSIGGWLRRRILSIPAHEVSHSFRGFREASPKVQHRLEGIGTTFLKGYHSALDEDWARALKANLGEVEWENHGFAYEGAAMALALRDFLTPLRSRHFDAFASGIGAPHIYMAYVGYGWALARFPRNLRAEMKTLDPLLGWLILDGYGFHEGYFHHQWSVRRQRIPGRVWGGGRDVFDQGLGRSLWFVESADVSSVAATISGFPDHRQGDLWSGVGLACAYAGGVGEEAVRSLQEAARDRAGHLAQGAAFAAQVRRRAGNPAPHTDSACRILCGRSAEEAAKATDDALLGLETAANETAYQRWRRRVIESLHPSKVGHERFNPISA